MSQKVLIIGGVAGGASTAARLRRVDESAEIVMFERGKYISFANCGLPYYIGGTIEERDALLVQTPEKMKARFNIDVRVEHEVVEIAKDIKEIKVKDIKNGNIYTESYDVLVLSPGSSPLRPGIPGIDAPNIFTLWNIPDTDTIKSFIDTQKPKKAAVIGGGFIGIEMVENLYDLGIDASLIEMQDQVMTPVDYEMAQIIHHHMASKGIHLHLKTKVESFEYVDGITTIQLSTGEKVEADIVMLSIGVRANSELAKEAGLEVNERGGIVVNPYLRTSDESIYALGDAVEVVDFIHGAKTMIPLAGPANKQGRIVANNIAGSKEERYKGTLGTSIAKVFDLAVASTGNNEKQLNRLGKEYGKDYRITMVIPKSHAGYYPGAIPMTIKAIFDLKGKILGAQIVGYDGVDKRIDVLATAIRMGGTIYDLKELELAYAPPFSSAKDPVNMVGFTAENILTGDMEEIRWDEIETLDPNQTVILDVREPIESELGKIPGSVNIPLGELRNRMQELDKNKTIIAYCAVGLRGYVGARMLMQHGYRVKNLLGGFNQYKCFNQDVKSQGSSENVGDCMVEDEQSTDGEGGLPVNHEVIKLNACGLQCPGPILQVFNKMKEIEDGEILEVSATDPGFPSDIQAWCEKTGNTFMKAEKQKQSFVAWIQKGSKEIMAANIQGKSFNGQTMVVFSGDLDKAIASFIIANGAASMGKEVTMFFTFWGLNILRKDHSPSVKKPFMDKMFGAMMPKGSKKLGISRMNMAGMGAQMIRKVMKDKNVDSLEDLMQTAIKNGVRIVACTMSMDIMGLTKEELINGIEYAGVASYLAASDDANMNLFI